MSSKRGISPHLQPTDKVLSADLIKELWDYIYSEDTIIRQCLSLLYYFTFEGGFEIKTKDDIVPTLFLDENVKASIYWFFHDLVKWITAVGFVPIVYPADMSQWAAGANIIEKVLNHFFEKSKELDKKEDVSKSNKNKKKRKMETRDDDATRNKRRKSEARNNAGLHGASIEDRSRNIRYNKDALKLPGDSILNNNEEDGDDSDSDSEDEKTDDPKKIEKKINKMRRNMNIWKTKRGFSAAGTGSMQFLPMCIPDPFLGSFEMYINKKTLQSELIYVPLPQYEELFSDKRVVVYMSREYRMDSECRLRTPASSLFGRYKICQVILENNLRAESELSKAQIITQMQEENRDPSSITQSEIFNEVEEGLKGNSSGPKEKMTFDQWFHAASMRGMFNIRSGSRKSESQEALKYNDDSNVNISVSNMSSNPYYQIGSRDKTLTLNQIQNQILKSIRIPESQKHSIMKDHIVLPGGFSVQNVSRPSSILDPQKYKEDYQNDVCTSLGVPYHLIATEKGKYKPTEGQDSLFRKSVSMIRNEIEIAFATIYKEAFSPLDGKLTTDVLQRLNDLTNGILEDIAYHQINRVYNHGYVRLYPVDESLDSATVLRDNVLRDATNYQIQKLESELNANNKPGPDGNAPPRQKISRVNVDELVDNMISENEDRTNQLSMKNTISEEVLKKRLYEPDETTIVLTKCRENIIRMVHLIEKSTNQQNEVRLQFKLPALVNLEMIMKYADFASNNPTMHAMVMDMGYNLFTSTK